MPKEEMEAEGASLTNTTGVWSIKVEAEDAEDEPQVWYVVKRKDDGECEEDFCSQESHQGKFMFQGCSVNGRLGKSDEKPEGNCTEQEQASSVIMGAKTLCQDPVVGAVRVGTGLEAELGKDFNPRSCQLWRNAKTQAVEADLRECRTRAYPETVDSNVAIFVNSATGKTPSDSTTPELESSDKSNAEEDPLMCEICRIGFKYPSKLARHMRMHTGEKPHACDICGKKYTEAFKLKNHRNSHLDVRPYTCEICGKGFSYWSNLHYHKVIHSEERSHACDICGKSFKLLLTLKRHRGIHTGEKAHVCKVCDKSFTQTSQLRNHVRIHARENPFSCEICHQTFTNSYSLNNHSRTHKRKKEGLDKGRQLEGEAGKRRNTERQDAQVSDLTDKVAPVRSSCQTILGLLLSGRAPDRSQKGKAAS